MRRRHTIRSLSVAASLLCAVLPFTALAQQLPQTQGDSTEIPARLRHLEGTVTVQRAAAGETEGAVVNLPLGSGDRVWTDDDGRVEITFEDGTSMWLDTRTTLDFVSLPRPQGDQSILVRLWSGSAFIHRPAPYGNGLSPLRIDAPTGSAVFGEEGLFRLDVDEDQTVWLSAYDGSAVLDAGGLSERIGAGQRTLAESGSAPARAVAFNTSESDDFTIWRDQRMAAYASTQEYTRQREYLPSNVVHHAADLEPYGNWSYHPTYASWYWKPYAAVAWTPYRDGRWVYTYSGWNWVPAASWGYVTTHYGRWHYGSSGWMWFPGRVWRPASVHWYVGGGYVGWVPLNYYNRPAVSFGVHVGGGVGVSVNVNIGGGYGYPYYGYGHSYWGYRPYYQCCNYYRGNKWKWNRGRYPAYPTYQTADRGRRDRVPAYGSASGKGRVINGRGYASGLDNAWTMVPADDFSTADVGRRAVRRNALPRGLDQAANAELTGNLRARRPGNLVPDTTRRAVTRGSVSNPAAGNGNPGAVRATTGAAKGRGTAQPRGANPGRSSVDPALTNGASRRAGGTAPTTGRAVRRSDNRPGATIPQRTTTTPGAVRRSGTAPSATAPQGTTTAPRAVRRRGDTPTATTPQRTTTAPGAVRRSGNPPTATTPQRTTTAPRAVRRRGDTPAATTPPRTTTAPRAVPRRGDTSTATTPQRTPTAPQATRRSGSGNTPRATTPPRTTTAPRAVRRRGDTPTATTPQRTPTAPRATRRNGSGNTPRATAPPRTTTAPRVVRRRGDTPTATTPQRTPTAPRATRRSDSGSTPRATTPRRTGPRPTATTPQRAPGATRATRRNTPRPSASTPQRAPTAPRATRRGGRAPTPTAAPRRGSRPGGSAVRSATPRPATGAASGSGRAAPNVRSSRPSSSAPRGSVRRAVPSGRTAPAVRPAPSGSSRPNVRAPSTTPRRSGGGAARPKRVAKPKGGSGGT